jgi:hypothetical protein
MAAFHLIIYGRFWVITEASSSTELPFGCLLLLAACGIGRPTRREQLPNLLKPGKLSVDYSQYVVQWKALHREDTGRP